MRLYQKEDVIIVGGRAAVGRAVADELESDLDVTVERLGGADRFATAALVAEQVLAASDETLEAADGVGPTRAKDIREGLRRLQEINLVDRYLQT